MIILSHVGVLFNGITDILKVGKGLKIANIPFDLLLQEFKKKLTKIMQKNRCLSIQEITDMVYNNKEKVRQLLHDVLYRTKMCAEIVPKTSIRNKKTT